MNEPTRTQDDPTAPEVVKKKPLQHKTVREVAGEEIVRAVRPLEARMKGMEDWLTENSKVVREELLKQAQAGKNLQERMTETQLRVMVLENPWYVRAWRWVRDRARRLVGR